MLVRGGVPVSVEEFVRRHVRLFNDGVRTGDFAAMIEGFTDDAELIFVGTPAGPYRGRRAIEAAYRETPPDDGIEILSIIEREDGEIVAAYSWIADRGKRSGDLIFRTVDGRIARLVVTFDAQSS
jgi:steroid delta-isomerase